MPIVTLPLPYQIQDGQLADAVPVMGNFNYLANQMNASIPAAANAYTPTLKINASETGIAYNTQVGYYWIVGPLVFVSGRITLSSKGFSVGSVTIGLPVPVLTAFSNTTGGSISIGNPGVLAESWYVINPVGGTSEAQIAGSTSSSPINQLQNSEIENNTNFSFSLWYPT